MSTNKGQKGFIALISVIILALTLLFLVVSLGSRGIYGRFALLQLDHKQRSASFAESCVAVARVNIAGDPDYELNTPQTIIVGTGNCTIQDVDAGVIKTCAKSGDAVTNLEVSVDTGDDALFYWKEVQAHSPSCDL